jgi:hypothetical protein
MKKYIVFGILLVVTFYGCKCNKQPVNHAIINSSDFYNDELDATPAFVRMIETLKSAGGGELIIEKGTYHFYPDKAFEKYCFISNHDDGLRSTPFPLIHTRDITIRGDSVNFIFHGPMLPFIIEGANNIHISGVSIDWEHPFHSEALVIANDKKNQTFDLLIAPQYPYVIRNKELVFLKEGYEHNLERAILWNPETMAVAYNTIKYTPFEPYSKEATVHFRDNIQFPYPIVEREPQFRYRFFESRLEAKELRPGVVRISGTQKQLPPVGMKLVCKGRNGLNRIAPAFRVLNSKNITLSNVLIHHAGGMGFIAEKSEDITLSNVSVELKKGSNRVLSTTADATHFVNCRGRIEMDDCVFANQLDDATNIHGTFVEVLDRYDEYTVAVKLGHFQQLGYEFAEQGDVIGFVNALKNYEPFERNVVKSIVRRNKRYHLITFEKALPELVQPGIVLDNMSWYPEVVITNCKAINNRARGFLISTPKPTLIDGCTFSNMMAAIFLPTELSWWYESGCAADLTIRNNTFLDCCYGGNKTAVIACHTNLDVEGYVYKTILIENNIFKTFDPALVIAEKITGFVFQNNNIERSATYPPMHANEPTLRIVKSAGVEVSGNTIRGGGFQISIDNESKKGAILPQQ